MTDREKQLGQFLAQSEWANLPRVPLAGDASGRRYFRAKGANSDVIVMDAPPENGEKTERFADIAKWLNEHGLSAPQVLAHDADTGFMVLEDLGETDFAEALSDSPAAEKVLYAAATEVLVHLAGQVAPHGLLRLTPKVAADMVLILRPYYTTQEVDALHDVMLKAFQRYAPHADVVALRDFHAENLIWRPGLAGLDRVGLLDFQDAVLAPAGYDLVSLLRDARRDVDLSTSTAMAAHYCRALALPDDYDATLALLGVQRNLRILGVFARLAKEGGKPQYLQYMPRVWQHIQTDLQHPALGELADVVSRTLHPPEGIVGTAP